MYECNGMKYLRYIYKFDWDTYVFEVMTCNLAPNLYVFYTFLAHLYSLKVMNCKFSKVTWNTWDICPNLTDIDVFLRSWPAIGHQIYTCFIHFGHLCSFWKVMNCKFSKVAWNTSYAICMHFNQYIQTTIRMKATWN